MADADPKIQTKDAEPITMADPDSTEPAIEPRRKRALLRPLLMFGVPAILLAIVGFFWMTSEGKASTDNAYVQQDKVSVSADVAGRIVTVAVRENQRVKKGDLLFAIDPDPYRIALASADAAIAAAQVQYQTLQTSYVGTNANIESARDTIQAAQEDYARQAELMRRGFTTRARLEQSQHALEQARATMASAQADAAEARSKLATGSAGENPQLAAARVQRDKALLDLNRTKVYAPADGIVSQADRLQVGQMMMTGLPVVTIVTSTRSWIEANFKETDLNQMRVGQCAEVSFDAYKGLKLKAHVASIGAGTGSEFAVLPAQNANGNWVKVTQRVPVRLFIDEASPRPLIAGLSSDVVVDLSSQCK